MKKILIVFAVLISTFSYAQDCDCEKASARKLLEVYREFSDKGLKTTLNGEDVMIYLIDRTGYEQSRQLCIDAWFLIKENGVEYTYERFNRMNDTNISKEEYLNNCCYLEMLSSLREIIRNNIGK